jgi:hypothetical protein
VNVRKVLMAEREGFYSAIPAILMRPKTHMHSSQYSCVFQAFSFRSLSHAPVSPVSTKTAKKGITRYHRNCARAQKEF